MGLFSDMWLRGVWRGYVGYVMEMHPILEDLTARGMPVSPERHAELSASLESRLGDLFQKLQAAVPDECKKLRVYKKKPSVREPFKPSKVALLRYIQHRGHRVPRDWKTDKETTREDMLRRLFRDTQDEVYGLVLDYRDVQTMLRNHLHNWVPAPDGRVHPVFYNTATGQLEARRPNTMNAPHHKASQKDFRSIVQAAPGHRLLSFDYKGFHALYLAWESGDKVMERVARIDLPSFATAHFLGLPHSDEAMSWPDDKLRDWLAWVKKNYAYERDAKMKHALHGYDNGMRAHGCYMRYQDFFENKREVAKAMDVLDRLFYVACQFKQSVAQRAHEQGFLISKFGCIRMFWEVYAWKGGRWSHGKDAEAAVSFIQQNHAHCHLKDVMLRLDIDGWLDRARFITPIHDDLTFECPESLMEEAVPYIRGVMEAPNPTTGLSVGVEVTVGQSWDAMKVLE